MVHVCVTDHGGTTREFDAEAGQTLRDAILEAGLPGIEALCGGAATCGTCHVYIQQDWAERVPASREEEDLMLEYVVDKRETSRLSCQIVLDDNLDGLRVATPEYQT